LLRAGTESSTIGITHTRYEVEPSQGFDIGPLPEFTDVFEEGINFIVALAGNCSPKAWGIDPNWSLYRRVHALVLY
jgi:hypothetical protein